MLKELMSLGAILQIIAVGNSHAVSSGMISATGSAITYSYTFIYQAVILYVKFFATTVELQSYNYPTRYIGLTGNTAYILQQTLPRKWKIVSPGLCGSPGTISIQSASNPNRYLRHRGFVFYEDPFVNTDLYRKDACFFHWKDKWFSGHDAFESFNFPGRFIRHSGWRL